MNILDPNQHTQRFCAEDMVNNKGGELDCDNGDIGCLCQNQDFIYGLRDCSSATCDDEQNARSIVEWGVQLCEGMLQN